MFEFLESLNNIQLPVWKRSARQVPRLTYMYVIPSFTTSINTIKRVTMRTCKLLLLITRHTFHSISSSFYKDIIFHEVKKGWEVILLYKKYLTLTCIMSIFSQDFPMYERKKANFWRQYHGWLCPNNTARPTTQSHAKVDRVCQARDPGEISFLARRRGDGCGKTSIMRWSTLTTIQVPSPYIFSSLNK